MTVIDKFRKLAADIGLLSGFPTNKVWDDAQSWKDRAKELISDVFSDAPSVRDRLLGRLNGVFVSSPSYSVNGVFIPSSSEVDALHDFERDILTAQDIMGECCREIERLSAKYR